MLSHEKLDVYRCATEFVGIAYATLDEVPSGFGNLKRQLQRASTSIQLNIAEGAGKHTPKESARFYAISRGSALECAAIFDTLLEIEAVEAPQYHRVKKLLTRIVEMLTKLCKI